MQDIKSNNKARTIVIAVLGVVLGFVFLAAGGTKVLGMAPHPANFARWGFSPAVMYAVGAYEVLGAALLFYPRSTSLGALLLIANMIGAVMTRLHSHEAREAVPPIVLMILLSVVGYERRGYLQSMVRRPPEPATSEDRRV